MPRKRTSEPELTVSSGAAAARRTTTARPRVLRGTPAAADSAAVPTTLTATAGEPTLEAISLLAYTYWEARGCQGGNPDEDWARAERELRGT
jgi:hypothetical protein